MGRRIHKKVRRGRKLAWCDTRLKSRWSGVSCDCGVRWFCL